MHITKTQVSLYFRAVWSESSFVQSDQSLRCPHEETLHPWLPKMHTVKILIRLRECAGWSETSLGAHVRRDVLRLYYLLQLLIQVRLSVCYVRTKSLVLLTYKVMEARFWPFCDRRQGEGKTKQFKSLQPCPWSTCAPAQSNQHYSCPDIGPYILLKLKSVP